MKVESISIKNIRVQQNNILRNIFNLAAVPNPNTAQKQLLSQTLCKTAATIEQICSNLEITPANLTTSSRQIYSWCKFLTDETNLNLHLVSTHRVRQITQQLLNAQNQNPAEVMIAFTNLAGLYQGKRSNKIVDIKINEGFIYAPEEVLQALVQCSIFGKNQPNTQLIRAFAAAEDYSAVLLDLDLIAEVIAENPQGKFYNLNQLFDKLNSEYFAAKLLKPRLTWSQIKTYRKFGHYEPARDRVVLSMSLDSAKVPEFVVEFVLYHELLHKHHGTKWVNGKRMVHTSEFRLDERKFKLYQQADSWLKKLTFV
ncbi:M48 family metallopeptidase [Nostoc sp. FACHB-110]|uniref:M48 family metallopeptidase n=1 Tax=Nostoc sp. FACHB-110 TaxID=2692834 RepID=UPI0016843EE0|nr:M48 family metallopeptidase [Nostoc sp. FACHB-110]MBD2441029.1 M48 family metallopeptidase [Nostoc sp. FACHB-110]